MVQLLLMETIILDFDLDFNIADTLNKKNAKQDVAKTLAKYQETLSKASTIIQLLQDNIADDEETDIEFFVNDDDRVCARATSELAERFVCFGIAEYDESNDDDDEDENDEDGDDSDDSDDSDNDTNNDDNTNNYDNDDEENKFYKESTMEIDLDDMSDSD